MVARFMPYVLTECYSLSAINATPARLNFLAPAQLSDCTTETAEVGSLRRLQSVFNVSSNKGTILRQFRGPFSPSRRQLCLPAVRLRLGGAPAALLCEHSPSKGRRGKLSRAAAAVSANSVPLEEVGGLQLKKIPAALQPRLDVNSSH